MAWKPTITMTDRIYLYKNSSTPTALSYPALHNLMCVVQPTEM